MKGYNYRKAIQVLNFFAIKEGGTINKMKAIKLIWLSDRAHLRKYGRPILNDNYYAMKFGPVPSFTKDLCECDNAFLDDSEKNERNSYIKPHHSNMNYDSVADLNTKLFSQSDLEILEAVYSHFGMHDPFYLANTLSHQFPEWKKHEETINTNGRSRVEMDYEDFFENSDLIDDDFFLKEGDELLEITKSIFKESKLFS